MIRLIFHSIRDSIWKTSYLYKYGTLQGSNASFDLIRFVWYFSLFDLICVSKLKNFGSISLIRGRMSPHFPPLLLPTLHHHHHHHHHTLLRESHQNHPFWYFPLLPLPRFHLLMPCILGGTPRGRHKRETEERARERETQRSLENGDVPVVSFALFSFSCLKALSCSNSWF